MTVASDHTTVKSVLNHAAVLHAVVDATRRVIMERLSKESATVSELAMPQAAMAQHLQVLEAAGPVVSEKVGWVRTCRLDSVGLRLAEDWPRRQRTEWESLLDRLGDLLAETEPPSS